MRPTYSLVWCPEQICPDDLWMQQEVLGLGGSAILFAVLPNASHLHLIKSRHGPSSGTLRSLWHCLHFNPGPQTALWSLNSLEHAAPCEPQGSCIQELFLWSSTPPQTCKGFQRGMLRLATRALCCDRLQVWLSSQLWGGGEEHVGQSVIRVWDRERLRL